MPLNIALLLAESGNLRQWDKSGTFDRQLAIYRNLQERGMRITILSPGGRGELEFASRLPEMPILVNSLGLPEKTYKTRIHQIHARSLLPCDILLSDRSGAMIEAYGISWAWRMPLIHRVGYVLSQSARRYHPDMPEYAKRVEGLERKTWNQASHVIATTPDIKRHIIEQAPAAKNRISIIPNYVDTDNFKPNPGSKRYDLIYVGRIAPVKNLEALLKAVQHLGVNIAIIGSGTILGDGRTDDSEQRRLQSIYGDLGGRVHWLGRVKNEDLPNYLNQAKLFVICSFSEGIARSLVEGMACGLPCIGTDVTGTRTVLQHEVNGYLCDTDADSIAAAIKTVLSRPDLMSTMGANARKYALENFSFSMIAQRQFDLIQDVARRHPRPSALARLAQYLLLPRNIGRAQTRKLIRAMFEYNRQRASRERSRIE